MRNHGLLSVANNIPEALYNLYILENACKIQVDVLRTNAEISVPSKSEWDKIARINVSPTNDIAEHVTLFWTALLRMLNRNGVKYCS